MSQSKDLARISKQLNIVVQDFINESAQIEQVAIFLKKGVEKQTGDIQNCLEFIDNFTNSINAIYEKSKNIISLAYEMESINQSVQEAFDQLISNQTKNDEALQNIFSVIKNLIEKTQKIGEITDLINRISNETNLLGLNAKVEAVHAGAAGKGFSVVANEIQRLSEESKAASGDISETIKGVTDEIALLEEVALVAKDTYKVQKDSVDEVKTAFDKNSEFINTYVNEQRGFSASIEDIKEDEGRLVNSISSIFASVREVSASSNEISSLTYNQNNTITLLNKLEEDLSAGAAHIYKKNPDKVVKTKPKGKIAIIFDHDNVFFDPTKKEAVKAAAVYNYEINFYAPKERGSEGVREMVGFLDDLIAHRVDGLVISPLDDDAIYRKLKQISNLGTKIVFINSRINDIDYVSYIHTNGITAGAAAARAVIGAMGNQGEVIVNSWSDAQISSIEDRKKGFIQTIKENTRIEIHEVSVKGNPSKAESEKIIKEFLEKYPRAKFIFLTNCDWGLLFADYVKNHHKDIQVVTIDFTKDIVNAMSKGYIQYAIGQRAYSWGSMAIDYIDKSYQNKPVEKYVDTGTYEVNLQNINIYKSFQFEE